MKRLYICRFLMLVCCWLAAADSASAQLNVLSTGNRDSQWRTTQLNLLEEQLGDENVEGELRAEVLAQQKWLSAWKPGEMSEAPSWPAPDTVVAPLVEPVIDPEGMVEELRERLLGPAATPTTKETMQLQELLAEYPEDVGVRQLHLHWLDQAHYRKAYPVEIAEAALRLFALLERLEDQDASIATAKEFCLYRRVRALAYRELPEVVKVKPIEDPEAFEAELLGAYQQFVELAGKGRSEFILLDIRMLRRDKFFGRALVQLTDHAGCIDPQWFLKKRRDLLRELGWKIPAEEAAAIYAAAYPDAVQAERSDE